MGPVLVLGPVRGVAEGFGAAREFTGVRLLARVGAQVGLQVLESGVRFVTGLKLKRQKNERKIKYMHTNGLYSLETGWINISFSLFN